MADNSERFEGVWNGKDVHPKRTWSGHYFTDDEVEALLRGEEITIDAKSKDGKPYKCKGKLADDEYNGVPFVGFKRTEFVNDGPPRSWCKHKFTDEEYENLKAGKEVTATDFVGQSGRSFKAKVKYDSVAGKIVPEFLKG